MCYVNSFGADYWQVLITACVVRLLRSFKNPELVRRRMMWTTRQFAEFRAFTTWNAKVLISAAMTAMDRAANTASHLTTLLVSIFIRSVRSQLIFPNFSKLSIFFQIVHFFHFFQIFPNCPYFSKFFHFFPNFPFFPIFFKLSIFPNFLFFFKFF